MAVASKQLEIEVTLEAFDELYSAHRRLKELEVQLADAKARRKAAQAEFDVALTAAMAANRDRKA